MIFFFIIFKLFSFFLIGSIDRVGPGQSPQKRLAHWSLANATAKGSKSFILIHKTTNRHASSVILKVLCTLRAFPTVPYPPTPNHSQRGGRLFLNPHCYEKQCFVGDSITRPHPRLLGVLHQNHMEWTTSQVRQSAGIKTPIHLSLK